MSDPNHIPLKIRFVIGKEPEREMAIWAEDMEEAKDFIHLSLRWAVKELQEPEGVAEIFNIETERKVGRMAVLFDESGPMVHEQWTWVSGEEKNPLH
jgi:hypothetical protein